MTLEKFLSRVEMIPIAGCWLWTGATKKPRPSSLPYGWVRHNGSNHNAHRVSWELHFGQIESTKTLVLHRCDNPSCVNPSHLFLGTHKDNVHDCMKKGRLTRGKNSGEGISSSKLKNEDIFEILRMRSAGKKQKEIGCLFNVSQTCISKILNGSRWIAVTGNGKKNA